MGKRFCIVVFFVMFCLPDVSSVSFADSAEVLPKGRFKASMSGTYYLPVEHRYDPDGDVEDIATDFNATMDRDVFPNLSLVEMGFGMPAGSANVGRTYVDFELQYSELNFAFAYGITDKLTVGINVPYWWSRNKVKSFVDSSNATIGKSAIGAGLGAALVPLAGGGPFGDAVALGTEDVQQILGNGLDVNGDGVIDVPGFGYKRFKTWSGEGIGDISVGFRYQYLKTKNWRLAANFGVRIPIGERDDPDNLVDFTAFSGEAYALFFHFNQDFTGLKNHVFNTTFRYDLILPDKQEMRVLGDVNQPLTTNKERVDRDIGDRFELEVSDSYSPLKGFDISMLYKYTVLLKTRVSGDMGFAYESLEAETRSKAHDLKIGLSYSTLPLFLEKKFPIPMSLDVAYRHRFAGSDNAMKSRYFSAGLNIYF